MGGGGAYQNHYWRDIFPIEVFFRGRTYRPPVSIGVESRGLEPTGTAGSDGVQSLFSDFVFRSRPNVTVVVFGSFSLYNLVRSKVTRKIKFTFCRRSKLRLKRVSVPLFEVWRPQER